MMHIPFLSILFALTPLHSQISAPSFFKNPLKCAATTNTNCTLIQSSSGDTSGTCAGGYTGSCTFKCFRGTWTSQSNTCSAAACGTGAQVRVFLTSGTSWTVPANWCSTNNSIEVIGGGGLGDDGSSENSQGTGGGGGAYSKISNLTLTPGASVAYVVGLGGTTTLVAEGGDTYFNGATCAGSSVCAKGGKAGEYLVTPLGGQASAGVGTVKYSGGTGSASGGGAAGPLGNGANGAMGNTIKAGAGGGGNGGGSAGAVNNLLVGGAGGNNQSGTGGGAGAPGDFQNGSPGTAGGGGGGGGQDALAGAGGNGIEWDATHGSGGGGGGAGDDGGGGAGGLYGGGGGSGDDGNWEGGAGGQGIIVITYKP